MKQSHHIGGSLLASNNEYILKPIHCQPLVFQVRPDIEADTHHLIGTHDGKEFTLASHPNGFSCHVLAERIKLGNRDNAIRQADYIVACAGTANREKINDFLDIVNCRANVPDA